MWLCSCHLPLLLFANCSVLRGLLFPSQLLSLGLSPGPSRCHSLNWHCSVCRYSLSPLLSSFSSFLSLPLPSPPILFPPPSSSFLPHSPLLLFFLSLPLLLSFSLSFSLFDTESHYVDPADFELTKIRLPLCLPSTGSKGPPLYPLLSCYLEGLSSLSLIVTTQIVTPRVSTC